MGIAPRWNLHQATRMSANRRSSFFIVDLKPGMLDFA